MTNEEVERAIDFLLKSQAALDARIARTEEQIARTNEQVARTNEQVARTNEQVARTDEQVARTNEQLEQTNRQLGEFADMQAEIMRVMTRTFEAQAQINESLRAGMRELTQAQVRSDRRLDTLVDIVRDRLGGQS